MKTSTKLLIAAQIFVIALAMQVRANINSAAVTCSGTNELIACSGTNELIACSGTNELIACSGTNELIACSGTNSETTFALMVK